MQLKFQLNKICFLILLIVSPISVRATREFDLARSALPSARVCRAQQGQNWFVSSRPDREILDIHLCRFGEDTIEGLTFYFNQIGDSSSTCAVKAFQAERLCQTPPCTAEKYCLQFKTTTLVDTYDTEGATFTLCRFADGSMIEIETLHRAARPLQPPALKNQLKHPANSSTFHCEI